MPEYYSKSGRHVFDGVEVLRYRVSLPSFSERVRISQFYRDIFDAVLSFCENELRRYSEERYTEHDLPQKKFRYTPLCYSLNGRVTYDDGELTFVKLAAQTRQREPHSDTVTVYDAHAWSLSEERMLPPRLVAKQLLGARPSRELGKNGFLVENGKYYVCYRDHLAEISQSEVSKK